MENKKKLYYKNLIFKSLFTIEDVMQLEGISRYDVVENIVKFKEDKTIYNTKEDKTIINTKDGTKRQKRNTVKNIKGTKGSRRKVKTKKEGSN